MWAPLAVTVTACCVFLAAWAGWRAVRDQPAIWRQVLVAAGIEVLLLAQAGIAAVTSATGTPPADAGTFWGYAVTSLLLLPVAVAWAFAERTRWSAVVLSVAALTTAFLQLRLVNVWGGG